MRYFKKNKLTRLSILFLTTVCYQICFSQVVNDSIQKSWWVNKDNSIFQSIHSGQYSGTTTGYVQLINGKDTLLLDFQSVKTNLTINKINKPVYDDNIKTYLTQTTSGKTTLTYETFMLANVMTIFLNGVHYGIGVFDGASDMSILGLTFNYCHENNTEYLTLFVTKPLLLTTTKYLFNKGNISFKEASKNEKTITVLPGSTLIITVIK